MSISNLCIIMFILLQEYGDGDNDGQSDLDLLWSQVSMYTCMYVVSKRNFCHYFLPKEKQYHSATS